jgi:hypothetical protein
MKARRWLWLFVASLLVTTGGCIVHDQLMTLTINPDGSAQLIVFRSNIRSTEEGQKADSEIAEYRASFNGQTQDEFRQISESGARIESAVWLRQQVPLANVLHATIPDAVALEKLATLKDDNGTLMVKAKFATSQTQRRLSFQVTMKPDQLPPEADASAGASQIQLARASGISEFRVAVTTGKITEARGFTIASDKQSALLDVANVISLARAGNGIAEFFVQWEVSK